VQVAKMPKIGRSAAATGVGTASEEAVVQSDVPCGPLLCRMMNFAELAFYEVRQDAHWLVIRILRHRAKILMAL